MSYKTILLYNNAYNGLPKDCEEYKILRIEYLKKYCDAIETENFWNETHYFQKLLTCISYDNFSPEVTERLYKVFRQRAEYLSLYYYKVHKDIADDPQFQNNTERKKYCDSMDYYFFINDMHYIPYERNLTDMLKRLFKKYQYKGFASEKAIQQYKETSCLFKCSKMEADMIAYFQEHDLMYTYQKSFPDLLSPKGGHLLFDGCVEKNRQLLLIECQGLQHFQPIEHFGGEEQLKKQKLYDDIKRQYCIEHKIPLLLIHYNQNVCSSISKFLDRKRYDKIIYEKK